VGEGVKDEKVEEKAPPSALTSIIRSAEISEEEEQEMRQARARKHRHILGK
jgi:hypothetical protein